MSDATEDLKQSAIYKELMAEMQAAAKSQAVKACFTAPDSFVLVINKKPTPKKVTAAHKEQVARQMALAAKLEEFKALQKQLGKQLEERT